MLSYSTNHAKDKDMKPHGSGSRLHILLAEDFRTEELRNQASAAIARLLTDAKPANEKEKVRLLISLVANSVAIAQAECDNDSLICYLMGMVFMVRGHAMKDDPTTMQ